MFLFNLIGGMALSIQDNKKEREVVSSIQERVFTISRRGGRKRIYKYFMYVNTATSNTAITNRTISTTTTTITAATAVLLVLECMFPQI